jgi:hypothetical protein
MNYAGSLKMRKCFMSSLVALAAVLAFWPVALAQTDREPPVAIFRPFTAQDLLPPFTPWWEAQF